MLYECVLGFGGNILSGKNGTSVGGVFSGLFDGDCASGYLFAVTIVTSSDISVGLLFAMVD